MDDLTPAQRRKSMQRIRSKDTSIEIRLRKALWAKGYRYRKNYKALPGKPDIAITKHKVAIFCDSEFFHGKDWDRVKQRVLKGNNAEYWVKKIERNMERDREHDLALMAMGWTVVHFWGKDIMRDTNGCVDGIEAIIEEVARKGYEDTILL